MTVAHCPSNCPCWILTACGMDMVIGHGATLTLTLPTLPLKLILTLLTPPTLTPTLNATPTCHDVIVHSCCLDISLPISLLSTIQHHATFRHHCLPCCLSCVLSLPVSFSSSFFFVFVFLSLSLSLS